MSIKQRIRHWLLEKLGAVCKDIAMQRANAQFDYGYDAGKIEGKALARIHHRLLPMPFDESQLSGAQYGMYITPAGFGVDAFGECTIPAPGQHGYEHRAYYVSKATLDYKRNVDLNCVHPDVFGGALKASESDALVPVIVTVLR